MGSYCSIRDAKTDTLIYLAEHKFFGYIEDKEIESLSSYKFLISKFKELEFILNITYIGTVAELTPEETLKFMTLYANDYGCDFWEMWGFNITELQIKNSCLICFD